MSLLITQGLVLKQYKMETIYDDDSIKQSRNTPDDSSTSGSSRKKSFIICFKDAKRAKLQLCKIWNNTPENYSFMEEDGDLAWGPLFYVIKLTWEDFNKHWLDVYEGKMRCWIFEPLPHHDDMCGRVLIYSIPSDIHEATAGEIL